MSDQTAPTGALRVCTYVGEDVGDLAGVILGAAQDEVKSVGANHGLIFESPVTDATSLARAVTARETEIFQLISHADRKGGLTLAHVWGDLRFEPARLAQMLRGAGVRVAVVATCYGAQIARTLVEAGAVEVAVGADEKLSFAVATSFSQGFYRSLALGRGPRQAVADGITFAVPRRDDWAGELRVFPAEPSGPDASLLGRPVFHIIGESRTHPDAVDRLIEALAPHRVFHVGRIGPGLYADEELQASLLAAKVVMVLFEGEQIRDQAALDEVQHGLALARRKGKEVRLFPLYLEGTRATADTTKVPYGLGRIVPAYLQERGIDGSYDKLAAVLKALLLKP